MREAMGAEEGVPFAADGAEAKIGRDRKPGDNWLEEIIR